MEHEKAALESVKNYRDGLKEKFEWIKTIFNEEMDGRLKRLDGKGEEIEEMILSNIANLESEGAGNYKKSGSVEWDFDHMPNIGKNFERFVRAIKQDWGISLKEDEEKQVKED